MEKSSKETPGPEVSTNGDNRHGGHAAAMILAIWTAVPPTVIDQSTYPDYYFGVTDSNHLVDAKRKFQRICEKSRIKKRHTCLTEEMLRQNPSLCAPASPSLTARQAIVDAVLPDLAREASLEAIAQWGQPESAITHLVFCTTSPSSIPGFDLRLARLLGLRPSVHRLLLPQQGCFAGGTALRVAKAIADSDASARVLIVCAETTAAVFRGPSESNADALVGAAIFGDGAAAAIVGRADPVAEEKPVFEIVSATQAWIPGTETVITGQVTETGLEYSLGREIPSVIAAHVESSVAGALAPTGAAAVIPNWNSVFWAVHPGGAAILDAVEARLGLAPERLKASRRVLEEFGNMSSVSVLFVMDELRKSSAAKGAATTGEGLEWGMLLAFGPGVTLEMVVFRSVFLGP